MAADEYQDTEILRVIWQQDTDAVANLDEECNPNKVCRNMKDVSFEGFGEDGLDVATSWKNTLAREGKLGGTSLGDLILGQ